jgi:hypothetical protein
VQKNDINVPAAKVTLDRIHVKNFQKAGLLLDGKLAFSVKHAHVGRATGPQGQPLSANMTANSLQISRGARGTVSDGMFKLNSHEAAAGVLLYNAKKVAFDRVTVNGQAPATSGVYVWNTDTTLGTAQTIHTTFTMRGGAVTRTAPPAAGTAGLVIDGPADTIAATVSGTSIKGWASAVTGDVTA